MLHLKKLSVGTIDIDGLRAWHEERLRIDGKIIHVTRSFPRRRAEILPANAVLGGSMYWVIKGKICARQYIEDFIDVPRISQQADDDGDGGISCGIVLKPGLVPVLEKRHRPFQGWRYLNEEDAPPDLPFGANAEDTMPLEMAEELRDLGLL